MAAELPPTIPEATLAYIQLQDAAIEAHQHLESRVNELGWYLLYCTDPNLRRRIGENDVARQLLASAVAAADASEAARRAVELAKPQTPAEL